MSAKPFGRIRRLADGAVFQALLRKGRRHSDGVVTARVLQGGEVGRLGLSIAKRHVRKATVRNALKRIVREAYRARGEALNGVDVLFMLSEGGQHRDRIKGLSAEIGGAEGRKRFRAAVVSVLDRLDAELRPARGGGKECR